MQPTTKEANNLKALSQHLYQTTARKDFREISGSLKRTLEPIFPDIKKAFPSEYYLLKDANSVEPFTLFESDETKKPTCKKERMITMSDAIGAVQVKMESVCKGSFEQSELKYEQVNNMIKEMTGAAVVGARIKGTHSDHLDIQKQSLKERHNLTDFGDNIIEVHCGDGARHSNNVLGNDNMITFSTQLFNKKIQNLGVTTSSSDNIFTHMQVQGKEDSRTVLAAVQSYFEDRRHTLQTQVPFGSGCKYYQYEIGDVKMLNMLLGMVSFNKIQGGCMYCKCNKREGVTDPNHQCELLSDLEHKECYSKAQDKFEELTENAKLLPSVDDAQILKTMNNWAGNHNFGITGFGIHPDILPISMVRPDVMHLTMAVTKSLLKYMHNLMHYRSKKFAQEVENIFFEFLEDEQILIWKLDKSIDTYDGTELRKFTKNFGFLSEEIQKRKLMCGGSSEWRALL